MRGGAATCGCRRWPRRSPSAACSRPPSACSEPPAPPAGSSCTCGWPSTRPTRCAPTGWRGSTPTPTSARCCADSPEAQIVEGAGAPSPASRSSTRAASTRSSARRCCSVLAAEGRRRRRARRRGDQPGRRVGRPARLRRRPAGHRGRGHVRLVPARLPRVLRAEHAAAVRHGHHRRRAAGGWRHERAASTTSSWSAAGSPACPPPARPPSTAPGWRCSTARPRPRAAATPATPRRSCG